MIKNVFLCVIVIIGIVIIFGCSNRKEKESNDDKSFFFDGASEYNSEDFEFIERHEEENC